jgi:uncharacterized membrane protein YecN with MAPEG domain
MATIALPITSLLAGFMAIFIMALNVQLTMRQIHLGGDVFKNMSDGAGDDILIRRRIAFMSAVFNIPMSILLLGLIELAGASTLQVAILAGILIICRILHVIGCLYEPLPKIRTFAITIQFAYFTVCGIWLMSGAYYLLSIK